jgi:Na+-translocating ferredoxin:NAD+ oxidoreductase subunit C
MPSFDVRLASTQRGAWPGEIPELRAVEASEPLLVPLGGREAQVIAVKPAGTKVEVGQMLTETAPETGHVPVAPVAGTLGAVRTVTIAGGATVPAVELTPSSHAASTSEAPDVHPGLAPADVPDHPDDASLEASHPVLASLRRGARNDTREAPPALPELTRADLPAWIDRLRRAGVHADRTTSPDLIAQLLAVLRRPVDTILCNALDGDPPMRLSGALAAREAESLVLGMTALRSLCGATAAAIVIDDSSPTRWVRHLRKAARDNGVRIVGLANDYPQGDPTLLVYALSGRKLRFRRLPVEQGVVMIDPASAIAVGRFIDQGSAMTHVAVGVFDHSIDREHPHDRLSYALAPIGMRISDLLSRLGVDLRSSTLRAGDLLRDRRIESDAVIAGGEMVIHLLHHEPGGAIEPCIRCGWCVQGCPTRVQPAGLLEAAQHDDLKLAEHYGLESCIECGICSFVCPSELPLLGGIRHLRTLRRV